MEFSILPTSPFNLPVTIENSKSPSSGQFVIFSGENLPLKLETRPLPDLGEGELLIRNEYTTLCKSDLHTYKGTRKEKCPTILGHEIVGRIVEMDGLAPRVDITGQIISPGDRITWAIFSSNPNSPIARAGIPQKGSDLFKYGHEQLTKSSCFHGGLSSHTQLRKYTPVIKLDESIPLPITSIINCALATIAGALRLAGAIEEKTVIVSGSGMLGLAACAMCSLAKAKSVIAVDIDLNRLEMASRFGATHALTPDKMDSHIRKADLVIETSGAASAMETSIEWLIIGGTTVWVGGVFPQRDLRISSEMLIRNLISIKGLHNYNTEDLISAVAFISVAHSIFPFANLIHDLFELNQAQEAFEYAISKHPFRVGIRL